MRLCNWSCCCFALLWYVGAPRPLHADGITDALPERSAPLTPPAREPAIVPASMRWEPKWREKGDCGPTALFVIMRLFNRDASLNDVKARLPTDPHRGCSLDAVREAAASLGLPAKIRFVRPEMLSRIQGPYICHLSGGADGAAGHFMPVLQYSRPKKQFAIIHTDLEKFFWIPEDTLTKRFSGYVLVPEENYGLGWPRFTCASLLIVTGVLALLPARAKAVSRPDPS